MTESMPSAFTWDERHGAYTALKNGRVVAMDEQTSEVLPISVFKKRRDERMPVEAALTIVVDRFHRGRYPPSKRQLVALEKVIEAVRRG